MSALRSLPLLSLAVAASCALFSGGKPESAAAARARAAERAKAEAPPSYDLVALDTWSALHEDVIALVAVGARRAQHDELRAYADRVWVSVGADRESLAAWRVAAFGDAPRAVSATLPGVRFAERAVDVDALERATPAEFDRVFLEMRIPLVEAEAALARDVAARATGEELRAFARQIVDEDAAEVQELRGLYAAWFDAP